MDGIAGLAAEIDGDRVARARRETLEDKLLDGPRLFAQVCEFMRAGIRLTHPDASEEEIEALLWKRNYGDLTRVP